VRNNYDTQQDFLLSNTLTSTSEALPAIVDSCSGSKACEVVNRSVHSLLVRSSLKSLREGTIFAFSAVAAKCNTSCNHNKQSIQLNCNANHFSPV
jgi:hypothetical protein